MNQIVTISMNHICCMVSGLVPHVGGPITGPGDTGVLVNYSPVSVIGDKCACNGGTIDTIIQGYPHVLINNMPVVVNGCMTAHGGIIPAGDPSVVVSSDFEVKLVALDITEFAYPKVRMFDKIGAFVTGNRDALRVARRNMKKLKENDDDDGPAIFGFEGVARREFADDDRHETQSDTGTVTDYETQSDTGTVADPETQSDTGAVADPETQSDNGTVTDPETQSDTESVAIAELDAILDSHSTTTIVHNPNVVTDPKILKNLDIIESDNYAVTDPVVLAKFAAITDFERRSKYDYFKESESKKNPKSKTKKRRKILIKDKGRPIPIQDRPLPDVPKKYRPIENPYPATDIPLQSRPLPDIPIQNRPTTSPYKVTDPAVLAEFAAITKPESSTKFDHFSEFNYRSKPEKDKISKYKNDL